MAIPNASYYLYLDRETSNPGRPASASIDSQVEKLAEAAAENLLVAPRLGRTMIGLECGAEMRGMMRWVVETAAKHHGRRNATLVVMGPHGAKPSVFEFYDAVLRHIQMPAFDRGAKPLLKVSLEAERLKIGQTLPKGFPAVRSTAQPKRWGSFKLRIDGLERECAQAVRLGAFEIGQGIKKFYIGEDRFGVLEPTKIDWPNISFTVPKSAAKGLAAWSQSHIDGRIPPKRGRLEYESGSSIFRIEMNGIVPVQVKTVPGGVMTEVEIAAASIAVTVA